MNSTMEKIEKELMILVGPIGVGKTTFGKSLENDTSIRISQDEQGKKRHFQLFKDALNDNVPRIIVDRMGFNREQRLRYINLAREQNYVVTIFEFKAPREVCIKNAMSRQNHPTVKPDLDLINNILDFFEQNYEAVDSFEYDNYNVVELDVSSQ